MKNIKHIKFLGYEGGTYASFEINRELRPNGNRFEKLLVAHERRWLDEMFCYPDYKFYEDVQKSLGSGFTFIKKNILNFLIELYFYMILNILLIINLQFLLQERKYTSRYMV